MKYLSVCRMVRTRCVPSMPPGTVRRSKPPEGYTETTISDDTHIDWLGAFGLVPRLLSVADVWHPRKFVKS
jgi:hypothetical protein